MSFELHPEKSLPKSVRKVAGRQLEKAHTSLSDSNDESENERVHAAPKISNVSGPFCVWFGLASGDQPTKEKTNHFGTLADRCPKSATPRFWWRHCPS